jgi:hypothetical protein
MNRIVEPGDRARHLATVPIRRGEAFCIEQKIDAIDYLKIDTEGHDRAVLTGFDAMLKRHAVAMVEVEAGLHPENRRHVPFEEFKAHLEPLGYRLFDIREIASERSGRPNLRRCNMVFASTSLLEANPRGGPPRESADG